MLKKSISLFFVLLFALFISAPTVISVLEKKFDTSVFFSLNEEENKSNETVKIFETKLFVSDKYSFAILNFEKEKSYNSYLKNYTASPIECSSPPPEQV